MSRPYTIGNRGVRRGGNFKKPKHQEIIRVLVLAGASIRQIVRFTKVSNNTAMRYSILYRQWTEGNNRRRIDDEKITSLILDFLYGRPA